MLSEDYVRTARAKGLRNRPVLFKHALRNAILPVVTTAGIQFGALPGGAIIVDTIFSWPGLGLLSINAIRQRDLPMVQGTVLVFALSFMLVTSGPTSPTPSSTRASAISASAYERPSSKRRKRAPRRRVLRAFLRDKLAVAGTVLLVTAGARGNVLALWVAPCATCSTSTSSTSSGRQDRPVPLGSDNFGRDILSRLIFGARISLFIGIVVVSIASLVGTTLGLRPR